MIKEESEERIEVTVESPTFNKWFNVINNKESL